MKPTLSWNFNYCGWDAHSLIHDMMNNFYWRINVLYNGEFSVNDSDKELIGSKHIPFFERLKDAQKWCSDRELELQPENKMETLLIKLDRKLKKIDKWCKEQEFILKGKNNNEQ